MCWRGIAHFEERTLGTWAGFRMEGNKERARGRSTLPWQCPLWMLLSFSRDPPSPRTRQDSPSKGTEPRECHVPGEASAQLFSSGPASFIPSQVGASRQLCLLTPPGIPPRLVHLLCAPTSATPHRGLGNLPGCLKGSCPVVPSYPQFQ